MGSFWKGVFFGNLRNKGIAFFFAVVIWFFAYQNQLEEIEGVTARYRIEISSPTKGEPQWTVVRTWTVGRDGLPQPFDGKVLLNLTGPRTDVLEYYRGVPGKEIDGVRKIEIEPAASAEEDTRTITVVVEPKDFGLPKWEAVSIDPKRIVPAEIRVEVNRIRVREVPIQAPAPPFQGLPHTYWQRDDARPIVFDPATVKIKGPAKAILEVPVRVEAPDIGRGKIHDPEHTFEVPLAALPRTDIVYVDKPAIVRMTIPFKEIATEHDFKDVPLKAILLPTMRTKDGVKYTLDCDVDRIPLRLKVSNEDANQIRKLLESGKAWVYFQVREEPPLNEIFPISPSEIHWAPGLELPDAQITFPSDTPTYRLVPVQPPKSASQ
ncbi:MAG: hypothetical protein JXP34_00835 [Planctomycetes bacterium]|nr:hypothetical protein [Planctomycetota bacterium]